MKATTSILLTIVLMGMPLPQEAGAQDVASNVETNGLPIVEIWENDDQPAIFGDPTSLRWAFVVRNNSDVCPPENPHYREIDAVRFFLYSDLQPTPISLPDGWIVYPAPTPFGNDLWEVQVVENEAWNYIYPGEQDSFEIDTYRPDSLPDVTGLAEGQGFLDQCGWEPQPPASFVGPQRPEVPGDLDDDGDVDLDDFAVLASCLAGPNVTTPPPTCTDFTGSDLDNDNDVDLDDFRDFQGNFDP